MRHLSSAQTEVRARIRVLDLDIDLDLDHDLEWEVIVLVPRVSRSSSGHPWIIARILGSQSANASLNLDLDLDLDLDLGSLPKLVFWDFEADLRNVHVDGINWPWVDCTYECI